LNDTPNKIRRLPVRSFIISRTDAIGDVVLTLPVAGAIRQLHPDCKIIFLGRSYTKDIIAACSFVDSFLDWDNIQALPAKQQEQQLSSTGADTILHIFPNRHIAMLAKKAGIKNRIGTTNRWYHWITCNKLVKLSRKNSNYHEAQLNLMLLRPLGIKKIYTLEEIANLYGLEKLSELPQEFSAMLKEKKFNLVIHPKSKGSSREWGIDHFEKLIALLPEQHFRIFITGTSADGDHLEEIFLRYPSVTNLTGRLSLAKLITFIAAADGLVACSTGPLHIAAAAGIHALGIYPPMRPLHPGRWAPVGKKTKVFVLDKNCNDCRKTVNCACIRSIEPMQIATYLETVLQLRITHT
jgi:heptosyltransferase-3